MDHVTIRRLEHLTGTTATPSLRFAVEIRDRPGPAHKNGAYSDDVVWVQLHGGLFVAKAKVKIAWIGEYSNVKEVRARTKGSAIHDVESFWARRPKYGYAAVIELHQEHWLDPFWAGPRTYGYEWILLDDTKKRAAWLDPKPPPRSADDLEARFKQWSQQLGG
ncbi:MAG: hypothetical protein ABIS18_00855 [Actinomycetota bacterium]